MVGRAALGRPWLFDGAYEGLDPARRAAYESRVIGEHLDLIEDCFSPRVALLQMKKHLAQYGTDQADARTLRAELFGQPSTAALRAVFARQQAEARWGEVAGARL